VPRADVIITGVGLYTGHFDDLFNGQVAPQEKGSAWHHREFSNAYEMNLDQRHEFQ